MIIFMLLSFVLVFLLLNNKRSKFSTMLISICFTFFYLYFITEILSLFKAISTNTIATSWIVFDLILLITNLIKLYIKKTKIKININIKEIFKKIDVIYIVIAVIMILLIGVSINTVPYNWDSMTYHLPRIMHWIQNGSIDHYATNIVRQITSPTFAEMSDMHIYLLTGNNDMYFNMLQTVSFIINAVIVYHIAKKIGCDKKFSILALLLALSMPIGFAEALTTQVDNFAALWCLIFTYFIIDFLNKEEKIKIDKESALKLICLGISLGFGYLTKPTVLFSDALFTLYLFSICVIRKDKFLYVIKSIIIVLLATIIIAGPNIMRNIKTFNAISDSAVGSKQIVHTHGKRYLAINFIKNLLWNYPHFMITDNSKNVTGYVEDLAKKWDVNINDVTISEAGRLYMMTDNIKYEHDYAVNPLIMWSLTSALIVFIAYAIKNKFKIRKNNLSYCLITILSFLIFIAIMRFQVWGTRYEISFLALLCPTVSLLFNIALDKTNYKYYIIGAISCIALISIWNQYIYHTEKTEVKDSINANYFLNNYGIYSTYSNISKIINDKEYKNIGLEFTEDIYEYPFYKMINNVNRIEHVNVSNSTNMYYDKSYIPEIVIAVDSNDDNKIYNDREYAKIYTEGKYSVYELK